MQKSETILFSTDSFPQQTLESATFKKVEAECLFFLDKKR